MYAKIKKLMLAMTLNSLNRTSNSNWQKDKHKTGRFIGKMLP